MCFPPDVLALSQELRCICGVGRAFLCVYFQCVGVGGGSGYVGYESMLYFGLFAIYFLFFYSSCTGTLPLSVFFIAFICTLVDLVLIRVTRRGASEGVDVR